MTTICGARTRAPDAHGCRKPAGWGTPTPGYGRCRLHGGASPTGKKHAATQQAKAEAARLGAAVPLDPADALTYATRLVGGEVEWLRGKLREVEEEGSDADVRALASTFAAAVERLARIGKLGVDAKLDERRLQLDSLVLDRLGGAVSLAITDAALDEDSRARLDAALRRRLGELSDDDLRPSRPGLTA